MGRLAAQSGLASANPPQPSESPEIAGSAIVGRIRQGWRGVAGSDQLADL